MSTAEPSGAQPSPYAGARLGLPPTGTRSVASWGRRITALVLDWLGSMLVAGVLLGDGIWGQGWEAWAPLVVFWLETGLLTALAGGSFGKLVLRVVTVRVDGRPLGLLQALLRSLLVCLVIPPVVYNPDRRGLHDLVAGTVTVRR